MKRKVALAGAGTLVVLVAVAGALWIWKPWVPPIELADPGPGGRRVDLPGVFGNYYPADGEPIGAILLIGGSLGGITSASARTAEALQQHGYTVLAASYFGAPGQPGNLERIPLETFDRALTWLTSQPEAPSDRVAIIGTSKGAEATLLVGLRHPEVRAVIAAAPSSAVWPGINWDSVNALNADSSWTSEGEPLPFLPYSSFHPSILIGDLGRLYRGAVDRLAQHPESAIPIEELHAPVLLVCGELDRLWPACPMSRQLQERADAAGGPPVQVLAYERVGHADIGPPYPHGGPTPRWGGTAKEANQARAHSWELVLAFLETHLARENP